MSVSKKRCFMLLLLAALIAFAIALPARAAAPVFSVTVPASLPVSVDAAGNVTVADDAAIVNNGDGAVVIGSITVTPQNGWTLCASSTAVQEAEIGSKCFALRFNGAYAATNGSVDVSGFPSIAAGSSMALAYAAAVTPQIDSVSQTIANVVFTVSWSGHGPLTGIAVTAAPTTTSYEDGDAFDSSGMAVTAAYADGTTAVVNGWTITNGASLSEGQTSVTVSYTEGGVTATATTPVTVASAVLEPAYAILYSDGEMVFQRGSTPEAGRTVTKTYSGVEETEDEPPWYAKRKSITTVTFADRIRPITTEEWFEECENLTAINGIEKLDTSLVTSMMYMFDTCESLEEIDVSGFDTSKVTNMLSMFSDCDSLTSLDLSAWDVSSVRVMNSMVAYCNKLVECNVSGWNTKSVTSLHAMFASCPKLTTLDVSGWDTSNVTSLNDVFSNCKLLTACGWEHWNTSSVTTMSGTFRGCQSITSMDLSGWDTSSVTTMYQMFKGCTSLTSIDLSSFNTGEVTIMDAMFGDCSSLVSLDISSFDTSSVTRMPGMFEYDSALQTIYASSGFTTASAMRSNMFNGCTSLVGGNGTAFNADYVDTVYARIDRSGYPGYFTEK